MPRRYAPRAPTRTVAPSCRPSCRTRAPLPCRDGRLAWRSRASETCRRYADREIRGRRRTAHPRRGPAVGQRAEPPALGVRHRARWRGAGAAWPRPSTCPRTCARSAGRRDRRAGKGPVGFDCGRAAQNMLLAAWDEGIVSSRTASPITTAQRALLGLGEEEQLQIVLSFGHPASERARRVERSRSGAQPRTASRSTTSCGASESRLSGYGCAGRSIPSLIRRSARRGPRPGSVGCRAGSRPPGSAASGSGRCSPAGQNGRREKSAAIASSSRE